MDSLFRSIRAVLALAAALAVVACDRGNAPTVASPLGNSDRQTSPAFLQNPQTSGMAAKNDSSNTKAIGPQGGELKLTDIIKVRFPNGALATETVVTICLVDRERVIFSITPSDLAMVKPLEITVDHLDRTDNRRFTGLAIYHQDVDGWRQISSGREGNRMQGSSGSLGIFSVARSSGQADGPQSVGYAEIEMLRWLSGRGHETKLIEADKGGEIAYGRYKIKVPKNALAQDTFVTVRDPGSGYLMCDLEPHGIQFLIPVELEMDIQGLDLGGFTDWTIFWFDDAAGYWEDQGGTISNDHHKLTADLMHFSRYAGGRAGW